VGDTYVYKVPTLRNIALTAPYFHTGKVWNLPEAVALMGAIQKGEQLSASEIEKIVAFLESLTGEQPKVIYPILPPDGATSPRPEL
jgi:cytochrome c peroxidase